MCLIITLPKYLPGEKIRCPWGKNETPILDPLCRLKIQNKASCGKPDTPLDYVRHVRHF